MRCWRPKDTFVDDLTGDADAFNITLIIRGSLFYSERDSAQIFWKGERCDPWKVSRAPSWGGDPSPGLRIKSRPIYDDMYSYFCADPLLSMSVIGVFDR